MKAQGRVRTPTGKDIHIGKPRTMLRFHCAFFTLYLNHQSVNSLRSGLGWPIGNSVAPDFDQDRAPLQQPTQLQTEANCSFSKAVRDAGENLFDQW